MSEYIEREKAFDAVFGQFCASSDETESALNAAIDEIKAIPAADVRPVVLCRDCALWNARGIIDRRPANPTKRMCVNWQRQTESEDYCSIGEAWRVSGPNCGADMRGEQDV